jgi:exonuclease III
MEKKPKKRSVRTKKRADADVVEQPTKRMASADKTVKNHKKTRRSTTNKMNKRKDNLMLMHMNVRGIKSKIKDIHSLVEENEIDIMVLTETKLSGKENRIVRGYKNFRLNRNTKAGGVCIYYKESLAVNVVKKNPDCETLWIKIQGKNEELVIGGVYSPCEGNISKQDISGFVRELEKDLVEIHQEYKHIMIVGDFNAHVGNDEEGIEGNAEKIGTNGKEYRRFIKERQLVLCNNTMKCKGKWTRNSKESDSILDLTLATEEALEKMNSMEIDEDGRLSIESKKARADHNATLIHINMISCV